MRVRTLLLPACCLALAAGAAAQSSGPIRGIDLNAIDGAANPCVNFYQYACGRWDATHPIPADEPAWGRFNALQNRNEEELRGFWRRPRPRATAAPAFSARSAPSMRPA